jgi:hypothetical protein
VCFGVASALVLAVFAIKGFFTENAKANIQLLHDAFFSSGILLVLFSGLMFVSAEGALLGVSYVLGRAIKAVFVPFGRKDHETYAQYRERKLGTKKTTGAGPVFLTGLVFVLVSVIFLIIWYQM